jgi:phage-related baseplate assembly protein
MPTTLDQLIALKTKEDFLAQLLLGLQGIGRVTKTGYGYGSVSAEGVAAGSYEVRARIVTAGGLNSGQFELSTDGGLSYGAAVTIPANGRYVVGSTGLTLVFAAGSPSNVGYSFEVGDTYAVDLATPTFPTSSWAVGSFQRTLFEQDALVDEDLAETIRKVAAGGFIDLADEGWIELDGEQLYNLARNPGTNTVGNVVLTDTANSGPHTIAVGQLWVATGSGLRYNNVTGGTLPLGGTLTLSFKAEKIGVAYNAGAGAIAYLLTSLAGVTVSNPNPVGGSWITSAGSDRESKAAYAQRCKLRWPALSVGAVAASYDLWAKTIAPTVTRTLVRPSPTVEGEIEVFLASAAGTVDSSVVTAVTDYIEPRVPLPSTLLVQSATAYGLTVSGTVYVQAGYATAAANAVQQNLAALVGGGVNSIGETLPGIAIGGTIYLNQLIEQIQLPTGVRNVALTAPLADVVLGAVQVPVLTNSLTFVEV